MDTTEVKQIVDEVADLIKTYLSLQFIAGESDYLPHAIAYALKQGFIKCNHCYGGKLRYFPEPYLSDCPRCNGTGKIPFTIPSMNK